MSTIRGSLLWKRDRKECLFFFNFSKLFENGWKGLRGGKILVLKLTKQRKGKIGEGKKERRKETTSCWVIFDSNLSKN